MTQKELKAMYSEILFSEVWNGNQRMVDHCLKEAAYIVELTSGDIVAIQKPRIQKDFCFGYSDSRYDTEDFDRANEAAHHAATSTEYFISENLKGIDKIIDRLEGKRSDWDYHIRIPYYGQPEESKLKAMHSFYWYDEKGKQFPKLAGEDRERVLAGYKVVRADFVKRLNSYLKRYGMSKVNAWSYWRDA